MQFPSVPKNLRRYNLDPSKMRCSFFCLLLKFYWNKTACIQSAVFVRLFSRVLFSVSLFWWTLCNITRNVKKLKKIISQLLIFRETATGSRGILDAINSCLDIHLSAAVGWLAACGISEMSCSTDNLPTLQPLNIVTCSSRVSQTRLTV